MSPSASAPALGTVLAGKYRVDAVLGAGGMGVVLAATHAHLEERVAIKLLHPAVALRPGALERFLREARVAMKLRGEHVVRILDVGMLDDGAPFIVMEYLSGRDLGAVLREQGAFASEWAVDCVLQACEAIAEAHALGVVHRDLKPANLFLTTRVDGTPCVKVLDFGVSKVKQSSIDLASTAPSSTDVQRPPEREIALADTIELEDHGLTRTHAQLGSPQYMAPEQLRSSRDVDGRADIWALGVILYELLSGNRPFDGDSLDDLRIAVTERDAPPLGGIAAPLAAVVGRAMSKSPDDRFATVEMLADALLPFASHTGRASVEGIGRLLRTMESTRDAARWTGPLDAAAGRPASAPPASRTLSASFAGSTARVRSRRAGLALVLLAALGVFSFLFTGARVGRKVAPASVIPMPSSVPAPAQGRPFGTKEARRVTFDQHCNEFPSLAPGGEAVVFTADDGDDEHLLALDLGTGARRQLTHDPGWQSGAAISPDGATVAYVTMHGDQHGVYLVPFDGLAPPRFLHAGYARPSWSPDGRGVWAGGPTQVERVNVASGAIDRQLTSPPSTAIVLTRELADGRVFAVVMDRKLHTLTGIVRFDAGKDEGVPVLDGTFEEVLAVAPDDASVLVSRVLPTQRAQLWAIPLDGAAPAPLAQSVVEPTKGLAIGEHLAIWSDCGADEGVVLLSPAPDAGQLHASKFERKAWEDEWPAGVGSSDDMVVVSDRSARRELWVVGTVDKHARRLEMGDLVPAQPAVSPDGRWVAFAVEGGGIYAMPLDQPQPRRLTSASGDREPSFGRDGATIYFETDGKAGERSIASVSRDGGPSRVVIARGRHPAASPTDDRVAYLAPVADDLFEPRFWAAGTRASSPISPGAPRGPYAYVRMSLDGRRVAIASIAALVEIDVRTGAVESRFAAGGEITGLGYVGDRIALGLLERVGELWSTGLASE